MHSETATKTDALTPQQQEYFQRNGYLLGLTAHLLARRDEANQCGIAATPGLARARRNRQRHPRMARNQYLSLRDRHNPRIHDLVEGIIGPNFYCWASSFFIKEPFSLSTVGWHQDAYYWPMHPHHTVTVWLAFDDADEENGADEGHSRLPSPRPHQAPAHHGVKLGFES